VLAVVKSSGYSALVTQDDDWPARVARLVAREVRRYRERRQPKMSAQQLADRTAELGMPIPRSVLANLESGRRETVTAAEVLVLAAALDVAPIDLLCPVGFDEQTEMLPGRMVDSREAVRWFCGDQKLEMTGDAAVLRRPRWDEHSNMSLLAEHDSLTGRWDSRLASTTRAALDEQAALAARAALEARAALDEQVTEARAALDEQVTEARHRLEYLHRLEWGDKGTITMSLQRLRAEMRSRGMTLPPVPRGLGPDDEGDTPQGTPGAVGREGG